MNGVNNGNQITDEQRLLRHLLDEYEKAVRPVRNASNTVVVRMGMTVTNIFDMVSFLFLSSLKANRGLSQ